jgi:hypothetical protein
MSAQAKLRDAELRKAEESLGQLNKELKLDLLQAGVDAAGVVDPTPVSDLVGAGISVYRGDFIGAGLSLVSMIPYAGDAIGKSAKAAKLAAKMDKLRKKIAASVDGINALRKRGRDASAAAVRAKRQAKAMGKEVDDALCTQCAKKLDGPDNPFGTRSPKNGWPKGVTRGDGPWVPDASTSYGKEVLAWQKKNGIKQGTPIQFNQGFPDFEPFAKQRVKIDMTGVDPDDFEAANGAMKRLEPGWKQPEDMIWHHSEDGVTMMLVPKEINQIPHTGGAALSEVPGF